MTLEQIAAKQDELRAFRDALPKFVTAYEAVSVRMIKHYAQRSSLDRAQSARLARLRQFTVDIRADPLTRSVPEFGQMLASMADYIDNGDQFPSTKPLDIGLKRIENTLRSQDPNKDRKRELHAEIAGMLEEIHKITRGFDQWQEMDAVLRKDLVRLLDAAETADAKRNLPALDQYKKSLRNSVQNDGQARLLPLQPLKATMAKLEQDDLAQFLGWVKQSARGRPAVKDLKPGMVLWQEKVFDRKPRLFRIVSGPTSNSDFTVDELHGGKIKKKISVSADILVKGCVIVNL